MVAMVTVAVELHLLKKKKMPYQFKFIFFIQHTVKFCSPFMKIQI